MKNLLFIIALLIPVIGFSQTQGYLGETKRVIEKKFSECEIEETDTSITVSCGSIDARFYFNENNVCYFSAVYLNEEATQILHDELISEGYTKEKTILEGDTGYKYSKEFGNTILYVDIYQSEEEYFCLFSKIDLK